MHGRPGVKLAKLLWLVLGSLDQLARLPLRVERQPNVALHGNYVPDVTSLCLTGLLLMGNLYNGALGLVSHVLTADRSGSIRSGNDCRSVSLLVLTLEIIKLSNKEASSFSLDTHTKIGHGAIHHLVP